MNNQIDRPKFSTKKRVKKIQSPSHPPRRTSRAVYALILIFIGFIGYEHFRSNKSGEKAKNSDVNHSSENSPVRRRRNDVSHRTPLTTNVDESKASLAEGEKPNTSGHPSGSVFEEDKVKLSTEQENADLLEQLANEEMAKGNVEASRQALEAALAKSPAKMSIAHSLVKLYESTGRLDEGLEFLKGLQNGDTPSGALDYAVGYSLRKLGRTEDAISLLQQAEKSAEPSDLHRVRRTLVDAYIDGGSEDAAIELMNKVDRSTLNHDQTRDTELKIAKAYFAKGERKLARERLDQWIEKNPDDEFVKNAVRDMKKIELEVGN